MSQADSAKAWRRGARAAGSVAAALLLAAQGAAWAGPDPAPGTASKFSNRSSVANTRHNLTQRPNEVGPGGPINAALMDTQRNNYGEVCVYCHTPHGANTTLVAPLWNRTSKATTYQTYDLLNTGSLTQPVSQPGASSLTCLSCHDGTTAVDAIVNMPGSGRYNTARISSDAPALLNEWPNAAVTHVGLQGPDQGCLVCHNPNGAGAAFPTAYDFSAFALGTDLRNDHPVGFVYNTSYTANATGYAAPANVVTAGLRLFGTSATTGKVECGTCHDPHKNVASFLRIVNTGSALCTTCHL